MLYRNIAGEIGDLPTPFTRCMIGDAITCTMTLQ